MYATFGDFTVIIGENAQKRFIFCEEQSSMAGIPGAWHRTIPDGSRLINIGSEQGEHVNSKGAPVNKLYALILIWKAASW